MHYLLKQAFDMGAQQALAELGLPGLDLDKLIQYTQEAINNAGGHGQDAGSIAEAAVGNRPQNSYNILSALSKGGF